MPPRWGLRWDWVFECYKQAAPLALHSGRRSAESDQSPTTLTAPKPDRTHSLTPVQLKPHPTYHPLQSSRPGWTMWDP